MKNILKYLAGTFYKPLLIKWLSKERSYSFNDIHLKIHPSVFHPGFFFSTKILLKQLSTLPLSGKKLLELGAGNGLISITAAKAGAIVTGTDINPVATAYLERNMQLNRVTLTVITSDLFKKIPPQLFDIIVINPPYYFKNPATFKDYAWNCGENGEYFEDLFKNLSNYIDQNTVILIILCEDCNRSVIQSIAKRFGFGFECIRTENNLIERNYIYQVHQQDEKNIIIQSQEQ